MSAAAQDLTIRELAELICEIVGFKGELTWDASKPDGTPRKLLDISKIESLGWKPTIPLREGISRPTSGSKRRAADLERDAISHVQNQTARTRTSEGHASACPGRAKCVIPELILITRVAVAHSRCWRHNLPATKTKEFQKRTAVFDLLEVTDNPLVSQSSVDISTRRFVPSVLRQG